MDQPPSTTGDNGRGASGRFGPGNKYAKGNPHAKHVARLRSALLKAVKPADVKAVATKLLAKAKKGEVAAIRELFQRLFGPAESVDFAERLEALERAIEELRMKG